MISLDQKMYSMGKQPVDIQANSGISADSYSITWTSSLRYCACVLHTQLRRFSLNLTCLIVSDLALITVHHCKYH